MLLMRMSVQAVAGTTVLQANYPVLASVCSGMPMSNCGIAGQSATRRTTEAGSVSATWYRCVLMRTSIPVYQVKGMRSLV